MSEETAPPRYTIHRASRPPSLAAEVGSVPAGWSRAEVGVIENWHEKSSSHRPLTYFRVLYDRHALYVRFDVMDRHVRCIRKKPQSNVCEDSCVEFFVQPAPGKAYFNFEISAAGTMLLYFIEDARRLRAASQVRRGAGVAAPGRDGHSLPGLVRRLIAGPLAAIAYRIPLALHGARRVRVARGDVRATSSVAATGDPHWGMVGRRQEANPPAAGVRRTGFWLSA